MAIKDPFALLYATYNQGEQKQVVYKGLHSFIATSKECNLVDANINE